MQRADTRETFWQTLLTFSITRIVIAAVLFVYLVFSLKRGGADASDQLAYWGTAFGYFMLAIGFTMLALRYQHRFLLQLLAQVAIDILVISALYAAAGGTKTGLAILYLFPLAGGAILAPLLLSFFFVSIATLFLLVENTYQTLTAGSEPAFSQIGLYGVAFFTSVFIINRLAASLIKQEELAMQRGIDLQMQESINRLVIADMGDGILVVGPDSEILTINPAAERMLGLSIPYQRPYYRLTDIALLMPIADVFFAWMKGASDRAAAPVDASAFVVVKRGDDAILPAATVAWSGRYDLAAHLMLRFAMVETPDRVEDRTVIFMQDVTEIENRAQQLKLASMGRLTASIAHEVRNPLSAISYASSLLGEEVSSTIQVRLLTIIGDNVDRLNRMIEDILKLSRKAQTHHEPLALASFLGEILGEFRETHGMPDDSIRLAGVDGYRVRFDPLHLREVVMNLLTNAVRYASGADGSICVYALRNAANRLELHVQDDGPTITPEVRAHLFEPFYTTSSKGTGLGLYLARELCLNNGAMIDYEYRVDMGNDKLGESFGRFVITFALADPV